MTAASLAHLVFTKAAWLLFVQQVTVTGWFDISCRVLLWKIADELIDWL